MLSVEFLDQMLICSDLKHSYKIKGSLLRAHPHPHGLYFLAPSKKITLYISIFNFFIFIFVKYIYLFYLFLAALGLHCYAWAFSSCSEWGLLFIAVRGLLIAVASLVAEHGL